MPLIEIDEFQLASILAGLHLLWINVADDVDFPTMTIDPLDQQAVDDSFKIEDFEKPNQEQIEEVQEQLSKKFGLEECNTRLISRVTELMEEAEAKGLALEPCEGCDSHELLMLVMSTLTGTGSILLWPSCHASLLEALDNVDAANPVHMYYTVENDDED